MTSKYIIRHKEFGDLLTALRQRAGIAQQSDLAAMVNATQQTVSRWESGQSRPRDHQIASIAKALDADVNDLLAAAGYAPKKMTICTLDQPFPVDALNPESFERFCLHFLERYYPTAKVHRVGESGHSQEGLDILAVLPDGGTYGFQCKRVREFGPQKVHTAVAMDKGKADQNFLLLSRVATPQARKAVRQHPQWDIWDKEDISSRIRQLAIDEQRRLVDIFFRGQRLALLGETQSGPWQTTAEFFAPFASREGVFTHSWNLVGRDDDVRLILQHLARTDLAVLHLIGAGGTGKSRVLKHAIEQYESQHSGVLVRFLSPTEEVSRKAIDDLGDREKLIVVDDAHDRQDLQILLQNAAIPDRRMRLLLALRPYGLDYAKAQASSFALTKDKSVEIVLARWGLMEATALAQYVLEASGGPVTLADDIARRTSDCPLATVIAAHIVSKKAMHFALLQNQIDFRSTLLARFRDVITGSVGRKNDAPTIEKMLRIIALLQPFHPDDDSICLVAEQIEKIRPHEFRRLVRCLIEAGVLFKRGAEYRLSPDMLADYIVEDACVGTSKKPTGYAEEVFAAASDSQIEHLLVNLGKLDWRLADGDPSRSQLLDGIWRKLRVSNDHRPPHIRAVSAVAYYQPERALDFAESLMRANRRLPDLTTLIRNAAYSYKHLHRCCECLWELARTDKRTPNLQPPPAIRILSELCAAERKKPIEYNEVVVDFGLSLIELAESWTQHYSPLDILRGILRTEGYTSESDGRTVTLTPFYVRPAAVLELRRKVIDVAVELLRHSRVRIAVLAARFLHDAIRYPMSSTPEVREEWSREFVQTLEKVENVVQTSALHPVVLVALISEISWHADRAGGATGAVASRILDQMPKSLDFLTVEVLIDGYGHLRGSENYREHEKKWNSYIESIAADLVAAYPMAENLRSFLDKQLSEIAAFYGQEGTPYVLYKTLIEQSPSLARATVEDALSNPESRTKRFSGLALSRILCDEHTEGVRVARRLLEGDDCELHAEVSRAYSYLQRWVPDKEDADILRAVARSQDEWTLRCAADAIRSVARSDQRLAIELLKTMNLGASCKAADDALMMLHGNDPLPFTALSEEDVDCILGRLMSLRELGGYWVETFLSEVSRYYPILCLQFFTARAEHAIDAQDWSYRVCNYGPNANVGLRFRESAAFPELFRQLSQWMERRSIDEPLFHYWAGKLFEAIFSPFDEELIGILQRWIDVATATNMRTIYRILAQAGPDFVFEHLPFVLRFLNKSRQFGEPHLNEAISALFTSATTGAYKGTPGEPFPRDINMKERSEKALEGIARVSPAFELYQSIKNAAEHNIRRSREYAAALKQ